MILNQEIQYKPVLIYTDGAAAPNPGPGGYGAILIYGKHQKEFSGGFQKTTNNRMEMMAAIIALEALHEACKVTLRTDSKYIVDTINKGYVFKWRDNGWWRTKKDKAQNVDLWKRLLAACESHDVLFEWVPGHAGILENEQCDQLATTAAKQDNMLIDEGYIHSLTPVIKE
ncbi:MAG: ribonuclease HI [Thiomargarita sp.]|nr:ribonuclease HI [Thiomargarita sp.]